MLVPLPVPKIVNVVENRDILSESLRKIGQDGEICVDVGGHSSFHKHLSDFADLFSTKTYICLDINWHPGIHLQADAHLLPIKTESVDAVIINAVLEHVFDPIRVVDEVYRVLKPRGKVFGYVPFLYPYHGQPDCWRFTKDGLLYCLRNFECVDLQPVFGYVGTLLRFLTGFRWGKRYPNRLETIATKMLGVIRQKPVNLVHNTTGFQFFAEKAPSG